MSVVTNIILSLGIRDALQGKILEVNQYFGKKGGNGLVSMNDPALPKGWYGGSKMLEVDLFIGAFNHLDLAGFYQYLRNLSWAQPEAVQLVVGEQEDFALRLINIFPEAFDRAQKELEREFREAGTPWPPKHFVAQRILLESQTHSSSEGNLSERNK